MKTLSCRLSDEHTAQIEAIASARGTSKSKVLSLAVEFGLRMTQSNQSLDLHRLVVLLEFISSAVYETAEKRDPAHAERLLAQAQERAETMHA